MTKKSGILKSWENTKFNPKISQFLLINVICCLIRYVHFTTLVPEYGKKKKKKKRKEKYINKKKVKK